MSEKKNAFRIGKIPIELGTVKFSETSEEYVFENQNKEFKVKKNKIFYVENLNGFIYLKIVDKFLPENIGNFRINGKKAISSVKSMYGTFRKSLYNAVIGIQKGFEKTLQLYGVGFSVLAVENEEIQFNIGFSHKVFVKKLSNINYEIKNKDIIKLSSIDKNLVTQEAAKIRFLRVPDDYHGIGIRYENERLRSKSTKSKKK